ncbi:uncharacterized protein EDB91DRAFT_1056204 [Suillus paluster]|uniref:uncharacterized protein n=1 Tax=Suillus paluster TaxID=48578 RepID=UPI001B874117|nr:uncharacterized protein EDB91DRAFT_1056204 [Suillus paluster]KAG1735621.1 hypothetical protein EDB91DRAFT_1056204 [Suillus paluster]
MATLVLNPTDPSTIPSATDLEPDERWKSRLKVDIENNLRSMVDEATQNLNNTLTKAAVSAVERERLTEEHLVTMKSIRNIAQEQFRIALEHGRQERRYAASQTLDLDWSEGMIKEQHAILNRIEQGYSCSVFLLAAYCRCFRVAYFWKHTRICYLDSAGAHGD